LSDPPFTQASQLVNVLGEELQPYFDMPFAFFGHSMGALIAFELARKLRRSRGPMPVRLFLSGRRAPHLPPARPPIYHLPEAEFRQEVRLLQGTPEEVLSNEELMQILLPVLRADFSVCETYVYSAEEPLDLPLSVFGSDNDPEVNRDELEAWRSQTTGAVSLRIFEGNHFFLHPMQSALIKAIAEDILTS
jgi:medium-chain acyl-[acyl-carrier-protein] hydrolase